MLVGIAAEIPFVDLSFFEGPAAAAMGVDIAFIVGLLVAAVAYWIFTRSLDLQAETRFIATHPDAADPGSAEAIARTVEQEER
jgi:hypothetical protein